MARAVSLLSCARNAPFGVRQLWVIEDFVTPAYLANLYVRSSDLVIHLTGLGFSQVHVESAARAWDKCIILHGFNSVVVSDAVQAGGDTLGHTVLPVSVRAGQETARKRWIHGREGHRVQRLPP